MMLLLLRVVQMLMLQRMLLPLLLLHLRLCMRIGAPLGQSEAQVIVVMMELLLTQTTTDASRASSSLRRWRWTRRLRRLWMNLRLRL